MHLVLRTLWLVDCSTILVAKKFIMYVDFMFTSINSQFILGVQLVNLFQLLQ